MEQEREQKQDYLRTHILEQNYDPEEFITFLIDKKGEDAADVDIWSFNELKLVNQNLLTNIRQLMNSSN